VLQIGDVQSSKRLAEPVEVDRDGRALHNGDVGDVYLQLLESLTGIQSDVLGDGSFCNTKHGHLGTTTSGPDAEVRDVIGEEGLYLKEVRFETA
jgi:hypothetical protein